MSKIYFIIIIALSYSGNIHSQDLSGYHLWLGYTPIDDLNLTNRYIERTSDIYSKGSSSTMMAIKNELSKGISSMTQNTPNHTTKQSAAKLVIATFQDLDEHISKHLQVDLSEIGDEGFVIKSLAIDDVDKTVVAAHTELGLLYGTFRLLRIMQMHQSLTNINVVDRPKIHLRMLNHWDNLDRTVERGYAGFSLWNWQKLPEYIDQRYIDYARANASIGINGTVLTNVNANALVLTPMYLEKVAALADTFRPYGIKVYLTARFSAPIEIGGLETADPLHPAVQKWWDQKVKEIYRYIPDFGGFLVKANSEGQPGPQNYGRNHVDGANMLGRSLKPYKGVVIWRAFVYSEHDTDDRAKQAYTEFVPFDGQFLDNVIIQSKNGAIDFQPREPFHPMFGAMPNTPLMMEFQITQEYLGFSTHLAYLPSLFEETLQSDTHRKGPNSTVSSVIDGSLHNKTITGMAGVANIGNDLNWTGHPIAQANWYGYGRLAWDPNLSASDIADEWIRSTYSNNIDFVMPIKNMMLTSREAVVSYMNPLGLHHLFDTGHHYGPGPWVDHLNRPEWNPTYYHKADEKGIGFDRTPTGSNATTQYAPELMELANDPTTCPEQFLLWFHHLPWDYEIHQDTILWDALAYKYQEGVDQVRQMIDTWTAAQAYISEAQYNEVNMLLKIQLKEAIWWKDASLLYFQTFSKRPIPEGVEQPTQSLKYYQSLKFPFAPGIRPQWD